MDTKTVPEKRAYDAILFDMDGLMVNTEELYYHTFNEILREHGASIPESGYVVCVGHPIEDNSRHAVEHFRLSVAPETFCQTWMDRFDRAISDPVRVRPMPGFLDLLAHVRKKGYPLGIASSTSRPRLTVTLTNGVLAHLKGRETLDEIFEVILSGSDVARTKPFPDIYLLAAERLRVPPARCLAFEDSESGVKAARAAGMTVIAVPHVFTEHQDHSSAHVRLTCLSDALKDGWL
jgi:HAD superfamily hydrolase (TIGR01509 family)